LTFEYSDELAMTREIYAESGHLVAYTSQVDGVLPDIIMVPFNREELFPSEFGQAGISERDEKYRAIREDIQNPRRGDTFIDKDGNTFTVDSIDQINAIEWKMETSRNG